MRTGANNLFVPYSLISGRVLASCQQTYMLSFESSAREKLIYKQVHSPTYSDCNYFFFHSNKNVIQYRQDSSVLNEDLISCIRAVSFLQYCITSLRIILFRWGISQEIIFVVLCFMQHIKFIQHLPYLLVIFFPIGRHNYESQHNIGTYAAGVFQRN